MVDGFWFFLTVWTILPSLGWILEMKRSRLTVWVNRIVVNACMLFLARSSTFQSPPASLNSHSQICRLVTHYFAVCMYSINIKVTIVQWRPFLICWHTGVSAWTSDSRSIIMAHLLFNFQANKQKKMMMGFHLSGNVIVLEIVICYATWGTCDG